METKMTLDDIRALELVDNNAYLIEMRAYLDERNIIKPFIKRSGKWGLPRSSKFDTSSELITMKLWVQYLIDNGSLLVGLLQHIS